MKSSTSQTPLHAWLLAAQGGGRGLADRIGVSPSTISKVATGSTPPGSGLLIRLRFATGLSYEQLLSPFEARFNIADLPSPREPIRAVENGAVS